MTINFSHGNQTSIKLSAILFSIILNGLIVLLVILSSGSSAPTSPEKNQTEQQSLHCRYIQDGRLFQIKVNANSWQEAEDLVCGAIYRDLTLPPLYIEALTLLLESSEKHPLLAAQRESCSCSEQSELPILQDIGIVEAPRLGAETKKTALPRIINTPDPTTENVVKPKDTPTPPQQKDQKPPKKTPSVDDLLNAANNFDEARPISQVDPGGSPDGSRLSKSATGQGDPYLQKIKARLDNTMNAPASIPKNQLQKLKARAWIKIGDNGAIWSWDFERKSGNQAFDRMVELNLKRFTIGGDLKFPPPPPNWKLKPISVLIDGNEIK